MSLLTDHPIFGLVTNILALADDERREERETPLPPELKAGFERIFTFARLIRDLLQKSAPEEVSFAGLRTTQTNLQQAYSELSAFFANGNQAHLTNALTHLDAATTSYTWTFYNRPVRGAKPQFENVTAVRKAAEKAIAGIQKSVTAFNDSLSATSAQLQAQNERIEQLSGTLEEVRSSSSAAVASVQQQFSETQSAFRNEIDALKKSFQTEREELVTDFSRDAEAVIQELDAQKDKAAKIVQVVGNIGVTVTTKRLPIMRTKPPTVGARSHLGSLRSALSWCPQYCFITCLAKKHLALIRSSLDSHLRQL